MKERPILFSGEMVRAILDGRKTQTRRVVKPPPPSNSGGTSEIFALAKQCPYGQPGDWLWVRETWAPAATEGYDKRDDGGLIWYRATDERVCMGPWRPSIFMPRQVSRIMLEITDVRVERLQDITEEDAKAEGVAAWHDTANGTVYRPEFEMLWDSINGKRGYGWDMNPWIWVIEFKKVSAA